jgi:glycosyltransferase involved in cell wall biosynthesis
MRIAHTVTLVSASGAYGGPVSAATAQLNELAGRGHEVELLSLWRGPQAPPSTWDGVPLRTRTAKSVIPRTGFLGLLHPLLLRDLWSCAGRADVMHVHAGRDLVSLAALGIAVLRRTPFLAQTHGMVQPRTSRVARLFDRCYVPLLRRARCCLVLTQSERAGLSAVIGDSPPPVELLNNGVAETEDEPAGGAGAPEVVFLARLHQVKRPEAFVEAAGLVHARLPGVRFGLYGADEGALPAVRRAISEGDLSHVVRYGGALPHAEALRRLATATVYVLPSSSEVFPMSLLEALAAGTPTVCTEGCGIAPELAASGASLVTDGSPRALADAVVTLLCDETRRKEVSQAGRRAVREHYGIAAVVDRLEELYRDV